MSEEQEVVKTADRLAALDTPTETEEPKQPEESETAEKPVKTPEEPVDDLPNDPREAGKAFAEMRRRNKELEQRLAEIPEPVEEVASTPFYQPSIENPIVQPIDPTVYNPQTGDFDPVAYQRQVTQQAQQEAARAADQRIDEYRQTQEVESAYPQMKPGTKDFDKDLYEATKAVLLNSMVEGKKVTAKQAVEKLLNISSKQRKELVEQAEEQVVENITAKEAASLSASGNSGRVTGSESAAQVEWLQIGRAHV